MGPPEKHQFWGPTPNLLNHNLFYKIPISSVCTLKFEIHWSKENPFPVMVLRIGMWPSSGQWDVKKVFWEHLLILLGKIPSFWLLCEMWHLELPQLPYSHLKKEGRDRKTTGKHSRADCIRSTLKSVESSNCQLISYSGLLELSFQRSTAGKHPKIKHY